MTRVGLVAMLLATVATAQDATQPFKSRDGTYTLHLPASWKPRPGKVGGAMVFRANCIVPNTDGYVTIDVHDLVGGMLTPLGQANFDRPKVVKRHKGVAVELGHGSFPHLRVHAADKTSHVLAYRRKAGHGFTIHMRCKRPHFAALQPAFRAIVKSFEADVERSPPEPVNGYERVAKDGFVYLYGPDVQKSKCAVLHKEIKTVAAIFEKAHGKVVRPADEPFLIIVHKDVAHHEPYWEGAGTIPIFELSVQRRIYVVPLKKSDLEHRATLASSVYGIMYMERYGHDFPIWLCDGLSQLQYARVWTGKPLPYLHPVFLDGQEPISHKPTEMHWVKDDSDAGTRHGFVYGFYFRFGPAPAKKAWKAFFTELAKTGDAARAMKRHFDPLNLDVAVVQEFFDKRAKRRKLKR